MANPLDRATDWSSIPERIIAVATDCAGMKHGFTTPPQYHGGSGKWSPTAGGSKIPLGMSSIAPNGPMGNMANQKVEYRPGKDPGMGKRPRSIIVPKAPGSMVAAQTDFSSDAPKDGEAPKPIVVGAAPFGQAPVLSHTNIVAAVPAAAHAGHQPAPSDGGTAATPDAMIVMKDSAIVRTTQSDLSVTMPSGGITIPTSITLPGAGVGHGMPIIPGPNDLPYIGDPPISEPSRPWKLMPPAFDPSIPYGPVTPMPPTGGIMENYRRSLVEDMVSRKDFDTLKERLEHCVELILWLVGNKAIQNYPGNPVQLHLDAISPPPVLTGLEQVVVAKLADLDREIKLFTDSGMSRADAVAMQASARTYWEGIKVSYDAKVKKGAKP